MSCVTSSTVRGSRRSVSSSHSCISPRVIASSAPNGSSRHSTRLPASSVRRKATRWRMPPDSSCGRASWKRSSPSSQNSAAARTRASRRDRPPTRRASPALSAAVSHGSSRSRWGIRTAGELSRKPSSGRCSLQTNSSKVLLPQPLGPTTATVSPSATDSETSLNADSSPKRRETPASLTADPEPAPAPAAGRLSRGFRSLSTSLPSRALPHRFKGSTPVEPSNDSRAPSQPASRQPPWLSVRGPDASARR
jgi:hypothetical protein